MVCRNLVGHAVARYMHGEVRSVTARLGVARLVQVGHGKVQAWRGRIAFGMLRLVRTRLVCIR